MLCASHAKKTSIKNFWVNSHAQIAWPTLTLPKTRQAQPDPTIANAILDSTALERLNARPAQPDRTALTGHYLHLNASEASRQWRHRKHARRVCQDISLPSPDLLTAGLAWRGLTAPAMGRRPNHAVQVSTQYSISVILLLNQIPLKPAHRAQPVRSVPHPAHCQYCARREFSVTRGRRRARAAPPESLRIKQARLYADHVQQVILLQIHEPRNASLAQPDLAVPMGRRPNYASEASRQRRRSKCARHV